MPHRIVSILGAMMVLACHAGTLLPAANAGVTGLDDRRFAPHNVRRGMWSPDVFRQRAQGGIYFLEDYDEHRIPVLFIHGISGSPRDFRYLIERLDRSRLQPWVFFYASGAALHEAGQVLSDELDSLLAARRIDGMLIVAHSMGGLIARDVLIKTSRSNVVVPALVTISTPWLGHDGAALAARFVPLSVESWADIATGSAYLKSLFESDSGQPLSLPTGTHHHLIFSYKHRWAAFGSPHDEVVTVESQLSRSAQEQAQRVYGFEATHTEVLTNPGTADLLNQILTAEIEVRWPLRWAAIP